MQDLERERLIAIHNRTRLAFGTRAMHEESFGRLGLFRHREPQTRDGLRSTDAPDE